jgi:hypothetical protein
MLQSPVFQARRNEISLPECISSTLYIPSLSLWPPAVYLPPFSLPPRSPRHLISLILHRDDAFPHVYILHRDDALPHLY